MIIRYILYFAFIQIQLCNSFVNILIDPGTYLILIPIFKGLGWPILPLAALLREWQTFLQIVDIYKCIFRVKFI